MPWVRVPVGSFRIGSSRHFIACILSAAMSFGPLVGCMGDGSDSDGAPPSVSAARSSSLEYAEVEATYLIGTEIAPNRLSSAEPLRSVVIDPALPAGLTIDGETGEISGTPVRISSRRNYTVTVQTEDGRDFTRLSLEVTDIPPELGAYTVGGAVLRYGIGETITPVVPVIGGGAFTGCSALPELPIGLALDPLTCALSGTPTQAVAEMTFLVSAMNSGGEATVELPLEVVDDAPDVTYSDGDRTLYRGEAVAPIAYRNSGGLPMECSVTPALAEGLELNESCEIEGTPTAIAATRLHTVTVANNGGQDTYSIRIAVVDRAPAIAFTPSTFSFTKGEAVTTAAPRSIGGMLDRCSISPALPSGLTLSVSNCAISGTPTGVAAQANYNVTAANTAGSSVATLQITVKDQPPILAYPSSEHVFKSKKAITPVYPVAISGAGTVVGCLVSPALPAGLSLSSTCVISGTPGAASSETLHTISATNSGGSSNSMVRITVEESVPEISYSPTSRETTRNSPVNPPIAVANTGGTITSCAVTPALPSGIALSGTCGISGTPVVVSAQTVYTITASNSAGSDSAQLTLKVKEIPLVISYPGSPFTFERNSPIAAATPEIIGGNGTITACSVDPDLPSGLAIDSRCVIRGVPTETDPGSDHIVTVNGPGGPDSASIRISVTEVPPQLSYAPNSRQAVLGEAFGPVAVDNAGGPVESCVVSPELPDGLNLSSEDCSISGTPTMLLEAQVYLVTGTNSGGSSSAPINLAVVDRKPILSIPGSPFLFTLDEAGSVGVQNPGGGIVECAVEPELPAGLSLDTATCSISGVPSELSADRSYVVTATNTGGSDSESFRLEVVDTPPSITFDASPYSRILGEAGAAIAPSNSGGPIVGCQVSPSLPSGLTMDSECVVIGTPAVLAPSASYSVTAINSGGNSTATMVMEVVDVPPSITFGATPRTLHRGTMIMPFAPSNSGGAITGCTVSPSFPAGLSLNPSTCEVSGTASGLSALGTYTISASNSGGDSTDAISFEVIDPVPSIGFAPSSHVFTQGTSITAVLPANSGGVIETCAVAPALPSGLSLDAQSCEISGTPDTVTAQANYTVSATNTGGTSSALLTLTVKDVLPDLTFTPDSQVYTRGAAISVWTPANGGGAVVSCSTVPGLPSGLAISSGCEITGIPAAVSGSQTYSVTAVNSGGSSSRNVTIEVRDAPPEIDFSSPIPPARRGITIAPFVPVNSGGAITACEVAPALPGGLALASDCTVSGSAGAVTPEATYTFTATNSGGSDSATLSYRVDDAPPIPAYSPSSRILTKDLSFSTIGIGNGGGAITGCTVDPALPAGISLDTDCSISGPATEVSSARAYFVTATNSGGQSTTAITITVKDIPPTINYPDAPFVFTRNEAVAPEKAATLGGGAVVSCSVEPPLPSGLSIDSSTCAISGTPTQVSVSMSYVVTAANSGGSGTASVSISVNDSAPAISLDPSSLTFTRSQSISPVAFANSGGTITGCSSTPALPDGLSLSSVCRISGTPSAVQSSANYVVTASNSGGSSNSVTISIAVNEQAPIPSYVPSSRVLTNGQAFPAIEISNPGGEITGCSVDPPLPAGLVISNTCRITGPASAVASTRTYFVTATNQGNSSMTAITLTVNDVTPTISLAQDTFIFTRNSAISEITPTLGGGAVIACAAIPPLPSGLLLDQSTCTVSGTPVVKQTPAITHLIRASNSGGAAEASLTLTVNPVAPTIAYSPDSRTLTRGQAIAAVVPALDGDAPASCSSNPALPNGLTLSAGCLLSGTPLVNVTNEAYLITVTNEGGSASTTLTLTVQDPAPAISVFPNAVVTVARMGSVSLVPDNTGGAITSCSISPALPDGMTFTPATCAVGGAPLAAMSQTSFTLTASNAAGTSAATFTLRVKRPTQIVFWSRMATNGAFNGAAAASSNLWTSAVDGNAVDRTPATVNASVSGLDSSDAAWNASSGIVFVSTQDVGGSADGTPSVAHNLWNLTAIGQAPVRLTNFTSGGTTISKPAWSPNGSRIAFVSNHPVGGTSSSSSNIWIIQSDGTGLTAITQNTNAGLDSSEPVFSADGSTLYFASKTSLSAGTWNGATTGSANIWKYSFASSTFTPLTNVNVSGKDSSSPVPLADGSAVVFVSRMDVGGQVSASSNIFKMNPDGSSRIALTSRTAAGQDSRHPHVSSDGSEVVFSSRQPVSGVTASLSYNIWKMSQNGLNQTALTDHSGIAGRDSTVPQFSADGSSIVFLSLMDVGGVASFCRNVWVMPSSGVGALLPVTSNTNAGLDATILSRNITFVEQ